MKTRHTFPLALSASLLILNAAPSLADETASGYAQAYTCTACHGVYGEKQAPGQPRIGGRDFYELLALMADYRNLERFHPVMTTLMLSLDEVAMAEIAEYFATVEPARLAPIGAYGVRY